jgi:hypothetical protein
VIRRYLDASLIIALTASPAWSANIGQPDVPFVPKWSVPANGKVIAKPGKPTAPQSSLATVPARPPDRPLRLHLTDPAAAYAAPSEPTVHESVANSKPTIVPPPVRRITPKPAPIVAVPATPAPVAPVHLAAIPAPAPITEMHEPQVLLQPHSMLFIPVRPEPMPAAVVSTVLGTPNGVISAKISLWDSPTVSKIVENLVDEHFAKDPEAQRLDKQVKHYRTALQLSLTKAKDSLNYATEYQGVAPSQRMGKLVLSDKAKVRDATTAEYERQKYVDKVHAKVIASMMEIAMGLGVNDENRRDEIVASGLRTLDDMVGQEQSNMAYSALKSWVAKHDVPETVFKTPVWDTMERENKLDAVVQSAANRDPVVDDLKMHVGKYANVGKLKLTSSSVIESTLNGITMLSPGFAIPLGTAAVLNAYITGTGGSEEGKIEKELVYDKRIQSRIKVLNQEASLALDNYRFALVTHNAPLLALSQELVAEMSSKEVAGKIFSAPIATNAPDMVPEEKPAKHDDEDDDA